VPQNVSKPLPLSMRNSGFHKPSGPRYLPVLRNYGSLRGAIRETTRCAFRCNLILHRLSVTAIWDIQGNGKLPVSRSFSSRPVSNLNAVEYLSPIHETPSFPLRVELVWKQFEQLESTSVLRNVITCQVHRPHWTTDDHHTIRHS
jgi:hypothetical protein